ncbi:hypothetical protein EV175_003809, partial [Coemansia sp. RSA 1933]
MDYEFTYKPTPTSQIQQRQYVGVVGSPANPLVKAKETLKGYLETKNRTTYTNEQFEDMVVK